MSWHKHRWTNWCDRPDLDALSTTFSLWQERRCAKCKKAKLKDHRGV